MPLTDIFICVLFSVTATVLAIWSIFYLDKVARKEYVKLTEPGYLTVRMAHYDGVRPLYNLTPEEVSQLDQILSQRGVKIITLCDKSMG